MGDKAGGPATHPLALIPRKGGGPGIQGVQLSRNPHCIGRWAPCACLLTGCGPDSFYKAGFHTLHRATTPSAVCPVISPINRGRKQHSERSCRQASLAHSSAYNYIGQGICEAASCKNHPLLVTVPHRDILTMAKESGANKVSPICTQQGLKCSPDYLPCVPPESGAQHTGKRPRP